MKYIELIVLLNILIHLSFIKLSNFIMNRKNNWVLILISILIDGTYITLYLLIPEEVDAYKYLIILFLSIVPFISKRITITLFSSIIYLMFNFILGGFTGIIIKIVNHYLIVLGCLLMINILFSIYAIYRKYHIRNNNLIYKILIKDNKKEYSLLGFCDTGNFLKTDDNIPIIFINKKYKLGKYYKTIPIKTVSNNYDIAIYKIESFKINLNDKYIEKDVYIAYSDINYDVMFGCDLLGG